MIKKFSNRKQLSKREGALKVRLFILVGRNVFITFKPYKKYVFSFRKLIKKVKKTKDLQLDGRPSVYMETSVQVLVSKSESQFTFKSVRIHVRTVSSV